MKIVLTLIRFIAAIILITVGVNNLSQPSNLEVGVGMAEILLGVAIIYQPTVNLMKKI